MAPFSFLRRWTKQFAGVNKARQSRTNKQKSTARLHIEELEDRTVPSAAHDIVGLTALWNDPTYAAIDGQLPNGQKIGVAVIDTGELASHADLRSNFLVYYDAVNNTQSTNVADARDPDGHGTHVSGIILGGFSTQKNDTIGVAPEAGLVAIRGLPSPGDPQVTVDPVVRGLNWVLANYRTYNIKVVNMSLGNHTNFNSVPSDNDEARAIHALEDVGITVVVASGNSFGQFDQLGASAPAVFATLNVGNSIAVSAPSGSVRRDGGTGDTIATVNLSPTADTFNAGSQRSTLSNQVVAPGTDILSTWNNGGYKEETGTSMASPMVAGMVALMQDAAMTFGGRYLTNNEVVNIVKSTADVIVDSPDPDTRRSQVDANFNLVNPPRLPNGQINFAAYPDLIETGQSFLRINIQHAVQAVRALVTQGTGGGTSGDTNNTIAHAVQPPPINGTGGYTLLGRIGTDGTVTLDKNDVDLFQITLQTSGRLTISTQPVQGGTNFDPYMRLFNSAGTQIASNDDAVPQTNLYPALTTNTLAAGTYYVGISSFNNVNYNISTGAGATGGNSSGDYSITISTSNPDPNGVAQGALPIDLTSPNFAFPSGSPLAPTGVFVANKVTSEIGSDPNPDPNLTQRVTVGPTDVDMFKVVAPDTGHLYVRTDAQHVYGAQAVDTYVKVYRLESNGSLTQVGENDDIQLTIETDSFVDVSVDIGRTYYIALTTYGNRNFDPFNPNNRSSETNETGLQDAYFMFYNGDVNGTAYANVSLNDQQPGGIGTFLGTIGADFGNPLLGASGGFKDVDFLRLTALQSGALQVDVTSQTNGFQPVLGIWQLNQAQDNIVQIMTASGANPSARFQVTAGQTYWISITGLGNDGFNWAAPASGTGGQTGDYQMVTSLLTQSQFNSFSDNSIVINTPNTITENNSVSGVIGVDDASAIGASDVDVYVYHASVTGLVDFHVGGNTEGTADSFLRVFNSNGAELAYNDNASIFTTDSDIRLNVQAGLTYYIGVNGTSANARAYNPITGAGAAAGSQGSYSLSITPDSSALPAPTQIGPTGTVAAAAGFDMPQFSWSAVAGAAHYYLYVADNATGQAVINNPNVPGTSFTSPSGLTPGHSFTWYVGAISASGAINSYFASGQTFTLATLGTPTQLGPTTAIGAGAAFDRPTFSWSAVTGADHYYLYVVDTTTGQVAVNNPNVGNGTSFQLPLGQGLTPGHSFLWYLAAVSANNAVVQYDTAGRTFSLGTLSAPTLGSPSGTIAASAGYDLPTFSWNGVTGADHYYLYVVDLTTGQAVINNPNVGSGTSFTPTAQQALTPGHSFIWYVGAISNNGAVNSYNPAGRTFNLAPLANPGQTSPSGNVPVSAGFDFPSFTWTAVTGANHYYLYVVDSVTGVPIINNPNVGSGTTFTSTVPFTPGRTYTWYLAATGANSQSLSYNAAGVTFTLSSLANPTQVGPLGPQTAATGYDRPTFSWSSVAAANHYYLYVVDNNTGQAVVNDPNVGSGTSYQLRTDEALTPGHSFTWYLAAVSTDNQALSYDTAGKNFSLAALAMPTQTAPLTSTALTLPVFSWTAVAGADHYYLYVVDVTTGQVVINSPNATTGTSVTSPVALLRFHRYTWYLGAVSTNNQIVSYLTAGITFDIT